MLIHFDVGGLDDRPPFLDLRLVKRCKRVWGLLVGWRNIGPDRREPLLERGEDVVVEGALHDEERGQRGRLAPLEDLLWIGLVGPITYTTYMYEMRPWQLFAINNFYPLVGLALMGAILGAWTKKAA